MVEPEKLTGPKTNLSMESMIRLLLEFINLEMGSEKYEEFFAVNDIGVPLADALSREWIVLTKKGENQLRETYVAMCALFDADPNLEFASLDELMGI